MCKSDKFNTLETGIEVKMLLASYEISSMELLNFRSLIFVVKSKKFLKKYFGWKIMTKGRKIYGGCS